MRTPLSLSGIAFLSALGCQSSSDAASSPAAPDAADTTGDFVMESDEFTIQPGSEKYYCYTAHIDSDTAFHSFSIGSYKTVHHMFFASLVEHSALRPG